MSLQDKIVQIEKGLRQLQDELNQAKQESRLLEEENLRLRRQLCQIGGGDYQDIVANSQAIRQTAHESLSSLYSNNFHICHLFFGRPRQGECLFCLSLLGNSD